VRWIKFALTYRSELILIYQFYDAYPPIRENKMKKIAMLLAACMLALIVGTGKQSTDSRPNGQPSIGKRPLNFTANQGQWADSLLYRVNDGDATLWLTGSRIYYQLTSRLATPSTMLLCDPVRRGFKTEKNQAETSLLSSAFVGANPNPHVCAESPTGGKSNFLFGSDPSKWVTDVPNYGAVSFENLYPGIGVRYYGSSHHQLEYDLTLAPGANPSVVEIQLAGIKKLNVSKQGELICETDAGQLRGLPPTIYQIRDGKRVSVSGEYVALSDRSFGFRLNDPPSPELAVTIDPVLTYSTYLGGDQGDNGSGIAVDSSGSAYVTGQTFSASFPTRNPIDASYNSGGDVFVTKLSPLGDSLVYSTFIGGDSSDAGYGIAVGVSGDAYVTGATLSSNFPAIGAYDNSYNGNQDIFVAKLSPAGNSLVYSTYLGGSDREYWSRIAVDAAGSAYVAGFTSSTDYPTVNAYDGIYSGGVSDAFVTKLTPTGSALAYSTFLGGSDAEQAWDIAVDNAGSAYVTGLTFSSDFPTQGAYDVSYNGGGDAFVTKLPASGMTLSFSTFLGGSALDQSWGIAIDAGGHAYVTGMTSSSDFPTQNAYDGSYNGGGIDAFATKLSATGDALAYSTYLGGSSDDVGRGIAVDTTGSAYITGFTSSTDFPTDNVFGSRLAEDSSYDGGTLDGYVAKLIPAGNSLSWCTYLGGSDQEQGYQVAVSRTQSAFVTGYTSSSDFPFAHALDSALSGNDDAFVARLDCHCSCAADPNCDHVISDVTDVILTINVAFRGALTFLEDTCPYERTDFDCSGATDILDVVKVINVAFRGVPASSTYCFPCRTQL
jgi:hypothetical protein